MNIAGFYSDVRAAIGRGAAIDDRLPGWAQEAISLIENSRTFTWMQQTNRFPLVPGAQSNLVVIGAAVKSVIWAKFGEITNPLTATESILFYDELKQVGDNEIISYDLGVPGAYYWDGVDGIILDAKIQTPATLFIRFNLFTQWPGDTSVTPPVLARHYQAFKTIFMMIVAANLRDQTLSAIWSASGATALQTLVSADTEAQWAGRRQLRMGGSQSD